MKKLLITLAIITITSSLKAELVDGYIIKPDSSKMDVRIELPTLSFDETINYRKLEYEVECYVDGIKQSFSAEDLLEFGFKYNDKSHRVVAIDQTFKRNKFNIEPKNKIFLHLEMDGKLKLYRYASGGDEPISQIGNGTPKRPSLRKFQEDMTEYLKDCPQAVELVNKRATLRSYIGDLIKCYNENCGS
jgi:hypothetical protein